jgi:GTP-binding protein
LTALDLELAHALRRAGRPVLVVANKIDAGGRADLTAELYRLGFGDPLPVSAEHGRGVAEMLEVARERAPAPAAPTFALGTPVRIAVIGRPNVGKSSLVNALVGAERVLVDAAPGTTRDAVDTPFVYQGRPYVLVDTAGIRRRGRVAEALEKLAVVMARKSLERCQVALVVVDASEGLTAQDAHIAGYADAAGRATVLVVNKWDLVPPAMVRRAEVIEQVRERLPFVDYAPVCFTSAVRGEGLAELFEAIDLVASDARRRPPRGQVLEALRAAVERRPLTIAGAPFSIESVEQVGVEPPAFALRARHATGLHFSYERYLVNSLRRAFAFTGSPIRLSFRQARVCRPRPGRLAR